MIAELEVFPLINQICRDSRGAGGKPRNLNDSIRVDFLEIQGLITQ